uniref:Protein kinase putative n=1 Tax=Albugo laibachii Nc14 TaxID=890382 RepID=F0WFJ2_9STRA|nr:protein kinase putative [Albugo laibachii Nc14]|eukprot:CCA19974.1 protein kinase putative [Albugo laibachii Nc14]
MWLWGPCAGVSCTRTYSSDMSTMLNMYTSFQPLNRSRIEGCTPSSPNDTTRMSATRQMEMDAHTMLHTPGLYSARIRVKQDLVAIKILPSKSLQSRSFRRKLRREIGILSVCHHHPNVMRLYAVYNLGKHMAIVFELAAGGNALHQGIHRLRKRAQSLENLRVASVPQTDLTSRHSISTERVSDLSTTSRYTERHVSGIIGSIASALAFLHAEKLFHGDIRPHHILYSTAEADTRVLLANFGRAGSWTSLQHASISSFKWENRFDLRFLPPFLIRQLLECGESHPIPMEKAVQIDVWALGVTMYVLLYADFPYNATSERELCHRILHDKVIFPPDSSRAARDLLLRMLEKDPTVEMTMNQVTQHPWIQSRVSSNRIWTMEKRFNFAEKYFSELKWRHERVDDIVDLMDTSFPVCARASTEEYRPSTVSTDGHPVVPDGPMSADAKTIMWKPPFQLIHGDSFSFAVDFVRL